MPEPVVPTTSTEPRVVTMVVTYIGAAVLVGMAIIGALLIISQINHTTIDAATLAVLSGLTGTALGALGTLLASTRSGDPIPPQVQETLAKLNPSETARMVAHLQSTDGNVPGPKNPVANDPATLLPSTPVPAGPAVWDTPPSA